MKNHFHVLLPVTFLSLLASCSSNAAINVGGVAINRGLKIDTEGIYASPTGGYSEAAGTREDPYALQYALNVSKPSHPVYLLAGTYKYGYSISVTESLEQYPATSKDEMKTLMPALDGDGNEDKVLFDFSSMAFSSSNRGLTFNTNYWHVMDFEVKGAGDNGVYIGGNNNLIEHLNIHDCQDSGLQLGRKGSTCNSIDSWPTNNTIKNCTSHDNHDPTGEDSDGFACKLTTGYGNVFDGCIAYNNVDDGWDMYAKSETGPIGPVTLKNCVSFNNGITTGGVGTANSDGNGFKLGGEVIPVAHKVINCLAFNNMSHGFTDNSNPGTISITNCTSYNNGTRDWDSCNINMCRDTETSYNSFKNILSYCEGNKTSPITGKTTLANSKDEYKGNAAYSVFYYGLGMVSFSSIEECDYSKSALRGSRVLEDVSAPFVSNVTPQPQSSEGTAASEINDIHTLLRDSDGSVKLGDLFKIKTDSPFYTMGEDGEPLGCLLSGD